MAAARSRRPRYPVELPTPAQAVSLPTEETEFVELARLWLRECAAVSSNTRWMSHPAALTLQSAGLRAVPHLVKNYRVTPRFFGQLLQRITGETPSVGLLTVAARHAAWRTWAVRHRSARAPDHRAA